MEQPEHDPAAFTIYTTLAGFELAAAIGLLLAILTPRRCSSISGIRSPASIFAI